MIETRSMSWTHSPLDLKVGHPLFLEPYWIQRKSRFSPLTWDARTHNYGIEIRNELKDEILTIHKDIHNAETSDHEVVVGGGATQLIIATLYAFKHKGLQKVYSKPPYYPHYPMAADLLGLKRMSDVSLSSPHSCIEFVTSPNNPDGLKSEPHIPESERIFDLCYNWPQYGGVHPFSEDIMIFSLSKATGHAATRIGWALVKDPEMAQKMKEYVHLSSFGVSVHAQIMAEQILALVLKDEEDFFEFGRLILDRRRREFHELIEKIHEIECANEKGMYAWLRISGQDASKWFISRYNTLTGNGTNFGASAEFCRVNLGCSEEQFQELKNRLKST